MSEYIFYYDETEHSRRINYQTVAATNYYDNFITVVVGWKKEKEATIQEKYADFEKKYFDRKNTKGELKSTTLKQEKFHYGFASQNRNNIQFILDFLSIFDEDIHVYFSVASKIEYIVYQLFSEYKNNILFDADAMKYSITKTLNVYRPSEVINALCNSPGDFVDELIVFFKKCIDHNKSNFQLKSQENQAYQEIISYLKKVSIVPSDEWNYCMPFDGFLKYLQEEDIKEYQLVLDKEGGQDSISKTMQAAIEVGLKNVSEGDSIESFGLRISDMMAGIIAKLMKSLRDSLNYSSFDESNRKKVLVNNWFDLTDLQFEAYKLLHTIICKWDHSWFKSYAGNYADDLVVFIALLQYIDHFESADQAKENLLMQGEFFNGFVCDCLQQHFERRKNKLPVEFVSETENEYFYNKKGAKVFFDINNLPDLKIDDCTTVEVLSVGINHDGQPLVTIDQEGFPTCYKLPVELTEYVLTLIEMANMGERIFPAQVRFKRENNSFFAQLLYEH